MEGSAVPFWLRCLAPRHEVASSSLRWIPISGLAWSLYKCVALRRTVYGTYATKTPLETIHEEKGISISRILFLRYPYKHFPRVSRTTMTTDLTFSKSLLQTSYVHHHNNTMVLRECNSFCMCFIG